MFNVLATIAIPPGTVLTGSGMGKTEVRSTHTGTVFHFGDTAELCGVEHLKIFGPGRSAAGGHGIVASRNPPPTGLAVSARLRLRNLYLDGFPGFGIHLREVAGLELTNVTIVQVGKSGVYLEGATGASCTNLRVDAAGEFGIMLQNATAVECSTLEITNTTLEAVVIDRGGQVGVVAAKIRGCGGGIAAWNGASGISVEGCEADSCSRSSFFFSASQVAMHACISRACSAIALQFNGGKGHTVASFLSDQSAVAVDQAHLQVYGGATGVFIESIHAIHPTALVLTWEALVAQAGGPVRVGEHNFTPAKIASRASATDPARWADLSYVLL